MRCSPRLDWSKNAPPRSRKTRDDSPGIARSAADVYRILDKAAALGADIAKPAQATAWGHAGYFRDLDGHLVEVLYEDGWQFDANDDLILD